MTNQDYIEFIDEVLANFEDTSHGKEGENCTKARAYLDNIKQQLIITNEASKCARFSRRKNRASK